MVPVADNYSAGSGPAIYAGHAGLPAEVPATT